MSRHVNSLAMTSPHYNYYRDYDPGVGRYLESDPLGLEAALNTFAYVKGSPLAHFDPFGLKCQFMGSFPVDVGTDFDAKSGTDYLFSFRAPSGRGTKPDCDLDKMAPRPPRRLPTFPPKTPLCQPEIIWEQWDFVRNWVRQLSRGYVLEEDIYICDPECGNDDGIRRFLRKQFTGDWKTDFERSSYAFERRGK